MKHEKVPHVRPSARLEETPRLQPDHSNCYPETTRAILLTNVNHSGDDVMCFTSLTVAELECAYQHAPQKITWDELYEVPEHDVPLYLYEPCHLTLAEEAYARKVIAQHLATSS